MIEVLHITGAYGIHGMVRVAAVSDNISRYKKIYDAAGREFCFKVVRYVAGGGAILALEGIHTRSDALVLKGSSFFVKKSDLPAIDEGEFYLCDLIGQRITLVESEGNVDVASAATACGCDCHDYKITNAYNFGAGDILEISNAKGEMFLVPFTRENFPAVTEADRVGGDVSADNGIVMTRDAFNWYKN